MRPAASRRKGRGYQAAVAIVYPGTRAEAAASLAVHALVELVRDHRFGLCERVHAVTPGGAPPRSVESRRPLHAFDLLAVSFSYEEQFVRLPALLAAAGIPPRQAARHAGHPLVLAGGMATRLAPRPVLPFVDLLAPGEAACVMPAVLQAIEDTRGCARHVVLEALGRIPGVLVPGAGGVEVRLDPRPAPAREVEPDAASAFGDLFLVETGRGCPAGCRFCAVGFTRRPPLFFSAQQVVTAARAGVEAGRKVGLVGASLSRHPRLAEMIDMLEQAGADLSPASLHPGLIAGAQGPQLLAHLSRAGQRTMTLAPETGSVRLGRMINKPVEPDELELAAARLAEAGILHLKLYLLYGLPTERDEDLQATVDMVRRVRDRLVGGQRGRGRAGRLSISLNPFVPKPHTPFGLEAMPTAAALRRSRKWLSGQLRKAGASAVGGLSPRRAILQCLVDRADESLAGLLERAGGRWPPPAGLVTEQVPHQEQLVHLPWPDGAVTPWNLVKLASGRETLTSERERAMQGRITPACHPARCASCGGCPGLT